MYDQCVPHFAPSSTHCFNSEICFGVSLRFESGGGIISSASLLDTRTITSLSALLPGTIIVRSFFFRNAPSLVSRRKPALRAASSGPWQW